MRKDRDSRKYSALRSKIASAKDVFKEMEIQGVDHYSKMWWAIAQGGRYCGNLDCPGASKS